MGIASGRYHKPFNTALLVPMFHTESIAEPKHTVIVALSDLITFITNDTNIYNMLSIEDPLIFDSIQC